MPSRRELIMMTDEERKHFLAETQTIIINTIGKDGVPHPMPMWFGIEDDDVIVMSTFTKSQKIVNLKRDPRVSLLAESGTAYDQLRGVVIYGEAELIRDDDAVADILVQVNARAMNNPDVDTAQLREAVKGTAPKRTGIRVRPQKILSWDHRKLGGRY